MARTRSRKRTVNVGPCAVPDCERQAVRRGLCKCHYSLATQSPHSPGGRIAASHILPARGDPDAAPVPRRIVPGGGIVVKLPPAAPLDPSDPTDQSYPPGDAARERADRIIAHTLDAATALGMLRVRHGDGWAVLNPATGRGRYITPGGTITDARLDLPASCTRGGGADPDLIASMREMLVTPGVTAHELPGGGVLLVRGRDGDDTAVIAPDGTVHQVRLHTGEEH